MSLAWWIHIGKNSQIIPHFLLSASRAKVFCRTPVVVGSNWSRDESPPYRIDSAPQPFQWQRARYTVVQRGSRAIRGRTVREGTGDLLPAGFTESPANSPAQDLIVASLYGEKYNAQTIALYYFEMAQNQSDVNWDNITLCIVSMVQVHKLGKISWEKKRGNFHAYFISSFLKSL